MTTKNTSITQRLAKIPQMWIAGFTRNGATVLQAIEHWEDQERLSMIKPCFTCGSTSLP